MTKVQKTVTLSDAAIKYVKEFAVKNDEDTFSSALKRIVMQHRFFVTSRID